MLTRADQWMRGYRIARNLYANKGFYWRPDDNLSWCPMRVFKTQSEARADLRLHLAQGVEDGHDLSRLD
jgi:hypothetical protein